MSAPRIHAFAVMVVLFAAPSAFAQRFIQSEVSVGGNIAASPESVAGGWYVEGMKSVVPRVSLVGEVSGHYSLKTGATGKERWTAVLGGFRRRWVTHSGTNIAGQFLVGVWYWSQTFPERCGGLCPSFTNGFSMLALQPGLAVEIPFAPGWSARVKADLRVGVGAYDAGNGAWNLGGGVTRYWGRR